MERGLDLVTVGHILVDIRLLVDEIPGPDEEAKILDEKRGVGGSAANAAIAARRLGLRSSIVAKIGLDGFGRVAVEDLMREGVDITGLRVSLTGRTGFSIVARNREGNITIYSFKGASEELLPNELDEYLVSSTKFVHIASLRLDTTEAVMGMAKRAGVYVSWDPGRSLAKLGLDALTRIIRMTDLLLVNRREAERLTGEEDPRRAAELLKEKTPGIVVVKLGPRGSLTHTGERVIETPAFSLGEVVDTTGAGDVFASALIAGLLKGLELEKALTFASAASAIKVTRLGSHEAPHWSEVEKLLQEKDMLGGGGG